MTLVGIALPATVGARLPRQRSCALTGVLRSCISAHLTIEQKYRPTAAISASLRSTTHPKRRYCLCQRRRDWMTWPHRSAVRANRSEISRREQFQCGEPTPPQIVFSKCNRSEFTNPSRSTNANALLLPQHAHLGTSSLVCCPLVCLVHFPVRTTL